MVLFCVVLFYIFIFWNITPLMNRDIMYIVITVVQVLETCNNYGYLVF